jgi:peptidoglycan/LPS O-acetylase OafA/YrhL
MISNSASFTDSKKHYPILDGLRGVAAILVVLFHILETFTGGDHSKQIINHGYLAVDFFFLLSGFVIGYAYDDRWHTMSLTDFFKRRLIRLHPMIIMGMLIGAVTFYNQDSIFFPAIAGTPFWKLIVVTLVGFTLIPLPLSMDIRGWTEMHPLNGPAWSLFFEYVANILYALIIRKFSKTLLAVFVFIGGAALLHLAITSPHGDVIGGWSLEPAQLRIGFTRLCYPFFMGLLLSRVAKPGHINNSFFWCCLLLIAALSVPRVGNNEHVWMNGLYDSLTILIVFPLIVYLGASGSLQNKFSLAVNKFLGDISYPLYIIHYPFIYLYMAWVSKHKEYIAGPSPRIELVIAASVVFAVVITVAYLCVKFYDVPVRNWLTNRFMNKKKPPVLMN